MLLQGPAQNRKASRWDHSIPPLLRPLLRAFILGYASAVAPRILTLLVQQLSSSSRKQKNTAQPPPRKFIEALRHILREGLNLRRFPTFCAALVGGSTLLQAPFNRLVDAILRQSSEALRKRLSRALASFVAAWLSLRLLQSKQSQAFTDVVATKSDVHPGVQAKTVRYAGRTLDLTLFAATRAIDVIVGELWARRKQRRVAAREWSSVDELVSKAADPTLFATSSAAIMWAWFYLPLQLPRGYNKWIGAAAAVDVRLIEALRRCKSGDIKYGKDTGQAALLEAMCAEYKWPLEWGDPNRSVPFPCEMVHMGCGPSCEFHALSRFYRSWRWSMATYLPLSLLVVLRRPTLKGFAEAFVSAVRSSVFLGTYITLFYYGVCLARTRLGPKVLGKDAAACQRIDGGICVGTGCFLCGWSILIERAGRRKDMALFVAPRALATLLPRRYSLDKQWRETLVFAASTAVVFTCVLENEVRVRGVLGKLLGSVLRA